MAEMSPLRRRMIEDMCRLALLWLPPVWQEVSDLL
jgi:hypothetical protein